MAKARRRIHPHVLLSLVLYCYSKGIRSTRKIEAACLDDVGCRIITGNQQVDHATVARFPALYAGSGRDRRQVARLPPANQPA